MSAPVLCKQELAYASKWKRHKLLRGAFNGNRHPSWSLLDKIGWLAAGSQLKIEWNSDQIVLREVFLDPEVQREETRLLNLAELKQLRGGIGESYRQSIQSLLLTAPDDLTFKEIVLALSQRQQHSFSRHAIRSILHSAASSSTNSAGSPPQTASAAK